MQRLKEARKSKGWSQKDLALKADVHPISISHWETGKRKNIAEPELSKLATALGVSTDFLLGRTNNPTAHIVEGFSESRYSSGGYDFDNVQRGMSGPKVYGEGESPDWGSPSGIDAPLTRRDIARLEELLVEILQELRKGKDQ